LRTPTQLERWEMQQLDTGPTASGTRTKEYNALDTDSEDQAFVDAVERLSTEHMGDSRAIRCREGTLRTVRFYKHQDHTAPIPKFRGA
jgi:serine/threonine protein phosphatase PrpC